jgi:phosphatidylinositol-4,5-bisphosphate 3-kinase
MLCKNGSLLHIDFGHFLGNRKKKFGFKRERAPFIFTPQYCAIMGGVNSPHYNKFEELCGKAFNILRKHSNLLITLFMMVKFVFQCVLTWK